MNSVFVSSTFRDMHFERDVLNRAVSARLNRRLAEHNQSVRLLDLRWGVDTSELTEEEATERVLRVCFDTIDTCRPYIVILLGDRYGYIPQGNGLSVTHMEILRGALEASDPSHVFVYIRQADYASLPEDLRQVYCEQVPEARERLEALKATLLQTMPQRCRHYTATWSEEAQLLVSPEFESMVYADLEGDLLESLSLKHYRSELHKQLSENDEILEDRLQYAYFDEAELARRLAEIQNAQSPWGLLGQAGAGKSVYLSLLCSALRREGKPAHILFCGDNAFSASVRNAAETVLYALTQSAGEDYDFESNALLTYDGILQKLIGIREKAKIRSYLLLDAVDKCEEGMVSFLLWCHRFLSDAVTVVFSSRLTQQIDEARQTFRLAAMEYDRSALEGMANSLLKRYMKSLNGALVQRLCQKATTPLQLNILLLRLLNLNSQDFAAIEQLGGGMEAINTHLGQLIGNAPEDEQDLLSDYLVSLLESAGSADFSLLVLSFLVFSEHGLSETDLQNLMGMTTLGWVQMDYMDFLADFAFLIRVRENGRLDISHDMIRQAYRKLMHGQSRMICAMLTDYFFEIEDPEPRQIEAFFSAACQGAMGRRIVEYIVKHTSMLSSLEQGQNLRARQLRKSLRETLLQGDEPFMKLCISGCNSLTDICYFQGALGSALHSANDYLSDEQIRRIVRLCMAIPTNLTQFPAELALAELRSCEKFLERHQVTDPQTLEFWEDCRRQITQRAQPSASENDSIQEMLALLQDQNADMVRQSTALERLCSLGRQMAKSGEEPEKTQALLESLLEFLETTPFWLTEDITCMMRADVYTSLGVLGKTTRQWEKGIAWGKESEAIYQALYEKSPTPDMFRKYRERVYNVANIAEAWAMEKKTDMDLWERTRQCYARVYDLEMRAVAHGVPERELLSCASAILSYGTALVNCGKKEDGMAKFKEGIQLVWELTANNPRPELHLEMCQHLLECAYQLCVGEQFSPALELCREFAACADAVLAQGQEQHRKSLWKFITSFSYRINEFQTQLAQKQDLENILTVYFIADKLYTAMLPMDEPDIKASIMVVKRNIGNFLLRKGDYEEAARVYGELLELVRSHDLAAPGSNGKFDDQAAISLSAVFARRVLCLDKLGLRDTVSQLLKQAPAHAQYVCDHSESLRGDPARVLFAMGADLSHLESPLGTLFVMMAFSATQAEGYDMEKNRDTVLMILKALGHGKKDES